MKHIILPTDFSANALNASRYALELFKDERCMFHVVNCYPPLEASHGIYATGINWDIPDNSNRKNSEQGLDQFVRKLKKEGHKPWHFYKTISSPGMLSSVIVQLVEYTRSGMIIIGTKGASGQKGIFMGSAAVDIIRSVKTCPVLAIPENFNFREPLEIAFATDLQRFYSESELQPVIDLARAFASTIRVVNMEQEPMPLSEIQKFNLNTIQKHFGDIPHYVHSASLVSLISKTLELFCHGLGVYLLVLLNYPKSYLEKVSHDQVVKRSAYHTRIPLLVIPEMSMAISSMRSKGIAMKAT